MNGTGQYTLCVVQQNNEILLGIKKRGFGVGLWNSPGGKIESGETSLVAAKREVFEEVGLTLQQIVTAGTLAFTFEDGSPAIEAYVFHSRKFIGEPRETEEMKPRWFSVNSIPYDKMWDDDRYWLPRLLKGKNFDGKFHFGKSNKVLNYSLKELAQPQVNWHK